MTGKMIEFDLSCLIYPASDSFCFASMCFCDSIPKHRPPLLRIMQKIDRQGKFCMLYLDVRQRAIGCTINKQWQQDTCVTPVKYVDFLKVFGVWLQIIVNQYYLLYCTVLTFWLAIWCSLLHVHHAVKLNQIVGRKRKLGEQTALSCTPGYQMPLKLNDSQTQRQKRTNQWIFIVSSLHSPFKERRDRRIGRSQGEIIRWEKVAGVVFPSLGEADLARCPNLSSHDHSS